MSHVSLRNIISVLSDSQESSFNFAGKSFLDLEDEDSQPLGTYEQKVKIKLNLTPILKKEKGKLARRKK